MLQTLTDETKGGFMLPAETILRLLENGKWHHLKDIEKETQLDSVKVENATKFLADYNFVELDEKKQKVKLDPPTSLFLKRIRQLENEENP
jgi:hypothetical protein